MGLTLQSFSQFKSALQSGIVALTKFIDDFSDGSVANAMTETISTQLGFVQSQAQQILLITRASTCTLPDLITFVSDYYLSPPWLGPTNANGTLTFTRFQPSSQPQVLLDGTIVQNLTPAPSSALQYVVTANPADPNWSANAGGPGIPGRTLAPEATSLSATAQAVTAGTAGNVVAGTLTVIASPGVPFDQVTNSSDIDNGNDGETIAQLQQRFSDYISSRSGTRFAISAAVAGVQAGLSFTLNDLTYFDGSARDGNGTIVVDDGSGNIPQQTLNAISAAVTGPNQKSFGARIWVIAPENVAVTVEVTDITVATGFSEGDVAAAIQAAIVSYVNSNGVGGAPAGTGSNAPSLKLSYVGVANVVGSFVGLGPTQGLLSYGSVLVNGGSADVALTTFQLARTSASAVTVSS